MASLKTRCRDCSGGRTPDGNTCSACEGRGEFRTPIVAMMGTVSFGGIPYEFPPDRAFFRGGILPGERFEGPEQPMSGWQELRNAALFFDDCSETFLDRFTVAELLAIYGAWRKSRFSKRPDTWEERQVQEAIRLGLAPDWNEKTLIAKYRTQHETWDCRPCAAKLEMLNGVWKG